MHANLAEQIRAQREFHRLVTGRRPPRRKAKLPRQRQPDHLRLAYYSDLRSKILLPAKELIDARLVPQLQSIVSAVGLERGSGGKTDAGPGDVNDIVDGVVLDFDDHLDAVGLDGLARKYAVATAVDQREQLGRQLQAAVGVQVPIDDQKLGPLLQQFTSQNVALIKAISSRYFSQVETTVLNDIQGGKRWEEIADDLEERFDVSESSAKLIARDQVGKFTGTLNKVRQTALGITRFTWRDAGDNRVRDEHRLLNGQSFPWDDPPDEGIPGEPVNCRCTAEPDVRAMVGDLDVEEDE